MTLTVRFVSQLEPWGFGGGWGGGDVSRPTLQKKLTMEAVEPRRRTAVLTGVGLDSG